MTVYELETEHTPSIPVDNSEVRAVRVSPGRESRVLVQSNTFYSLISFSGMTRTPLPISEFVWKSFEALDKVQAVLAGESGGVLHVWVMVNEWTPAVRKQVYAIQKTIMKQLQGINFDFYVIDLPEGVAPEDMVSDIPLVFKRAS